ALARGADALRNPAGTAALRTGALAQQRQKPLLKAHPAATRARLALCAVRTGSRPGAGTTRAVVDSLVAELFGATLGGFHETHLQLSCQGSIGAPETDGLEEILNHRFESDALEARAAPRPEGSAAKTIVRGALLRVAQNLVGRIDFGETRLRGRAVLVTVRVMLGCKSAKGRADLFGRSMGRKLQNFVGVAHRAQISMPARTHEGDVAFGPNAERSAPGAACRRVSGKVRRPVSTSRPLRRSRQPRYS